MSALAAGLQPAFAADPVVEDAAGRAFSDVAARWFAKAGAAAPDRPALRRSLLQAVIDLGFADALPSPGARDAWPVAAIVIRAQARVAAPIDMALLLATGDREQSIGYDPQSLPGSAATLLPADAASASALGLGRCLQISAAMHAALELSLGYVRQRKQFGRVLAAFQAIQHSLALAAEEVAATNVATDLALACMAREGCASERLPLLIDTATLVAVRGVDVVHDVCHQVHGAIGFTREYALQRHSLDLLRWRDHLTRLRGGELRAAERLGEAAIGAGGVWRAVTSLMGSQTPA